MFTYPPLKLHNNLPASAIPLYHCLPPQPPPDQEAQGAPPAPQTCPQPAQPRETGVEGKGEGPHQAAHERLHDLGEGREKADPAVLPRPSQLQHLKDPRLSLESNERRVQAAVLRAAGRALQAPHGEVPRLQVPTKAKENLHCRREETQDCRVQSLGKEPEGGGEELVGRWRKLQRWVGREAGRWNTQALRIDFHFVIDQF